MNPNTATRAEATARLRQLQLKGIEITGDRWKKVG